MLNCSMLRRWAGCVRATLEAFGQLNAESVR